MAEAIIQIFVELFLFLTGKWLLPLLSGGRVIVMPRGVQRGWGLSPFQRLPRGQIGVDTEFVVLMALLFWMVVGFGLYFLFR